MGPTNTKESKISQMTPPTSLYHIRFMRYRQKKDRPIREEVFSCFGDYFDASPQPRRFANYHDSHNFHRQGIFCVLCVLTAFEVDPINPLGGVRKSTTWRTSYSVSNMAQRDFFVRTRYTCVPILVPPSQTV